MKIEIILHSEYKDTDVRLSNIDQCDGDCDACEFHNLEDTLGCELLYDLNKDGLVKIINNKDIYDVKIKVINITCTSMEKNKLIENFKSDNCNQICSECIVGDMNEKYTDFCYRMPFAYTDGLINFNTNNREGNRNNVTRK